MSGVKPSISPSVSYPSGSADAVAPATVGVADGELVVVIGVQADIGARLHGQAAAQLRLYGGLWPGWIA